MIDRLRASLAVAAAALLIIIPLIPQAAEAQARDGARFRVIVPDLQPTDGSRDRFGERVADRVRDLLDLDTHVAMSEREIDRAARDYDLRYRYLDCTTARQLASQLDVPLVMCGEYHEENGQFQVTVTSYTVPAGEEFPMAPIVVAQNDEGGAAQQIRGAFEGMVEQHQSISWCQQEYASSNWDQALRYCTRAVELAPQSEQARYALGRTYLETEQWEQSLEQFEHLLENDPRNDDVLENAAWVAGQLGQTDKAREYYTRFLEINPDNVNVRIRVAYELAQTGDSYGAMTLLEEGMEQEPENVDLHEAYGSYAFRAAVERQATEPQPATQDGDAPQVSPEVADLFRTAISSYEVVMEKLGSEARASYAVNSMRAYRQLNETDEAIRIGRRAAEFHPENAQIQSQLANAYNDAGRVDEAIDALELALELDPQLPQARTRQGAFLMQAGRVNEAVEAFEAAAEAGEQRPDQLAGMIFSHGYSNYIQNRENLQEGIRLIEKAKEFDVSAEFREQLHFFHGYALMRRGEQVQQPQNLESARASRPIFERSREMFRAGAGYAQRSGQNLDNLLEAVGTYLEIQDAIIARESR